VAERQPAAKSVPTAVAPKDDIEQLVARAAADLAKSRRAEKEAQRLAWIVQSSVDAVIGSSLEGEITDWNPAAQRLYGYTEEEALGKPVLMLAPPDREAEDRDFLARVSRGEFVENVDTVRRRKDGAAIEVMLSISPIRDDAGDVVGISKMARDVTARRHDERTIAALHAVAYSAGHIMDAAQLVALTTAQVRDAFGVDHLVVYWWDGATEMLRPIGKPGEAGPIPGADSEQRPGEGLAGMVFVGRSPLIVEDYASWPQVHPRFKAAVGSAMAVPMYVGEQVVGVLAALAIARREFTEHDLQLLTRFAAEVAPAIAVGQLITDAQARRAEAEALAARVSVYFRANPVPGLIARRADNVFVDVNDAFLALLGRSREELIGKSALDIDVFAEDQELLELVGTLDRGGQARGEIVLCTSTGERRAVLAFLELTEIAGEACLIIGCVDLSEQKRAIAEAEAMAARVSVYFRANPVPGLIARRTDNVFVDVNDAFVALLGRSREELIGKSSLEVGVFADPQELVELLGTLDRVGQARAEVTLRTNTGELRSVLSFLELTEIAGEACLIVGCVDLTEQKRALAMDERQHVVEQEASRAKSAFLANVSHELRTPLNAILGFSELLIEQLNVSERQMGFLNNVHEAGKHLLKLINDVLDISRVEAGKMELRREPMDLSVLLEPVIATMRLAADRQGVHFETSATSGSTIMVDPTRVRQILDNLLSNAVKFTPTGGRVHLTATIEDDAVLFEVRDSGVGIPSESHGRVFGTFERFHEHEDDGAPGTGLGLALTKVLVELHGGSITFVSAVGIGTTFFVRLPGPTPQATSGPRLLIVEDDRLDADLIVALAERHGLTSDVATSVEEALSIIARQLPVGIVLDLMLSDGRGELILRALRDRNQHIPAIVVTALDDETGERLAVDDYLRKPIETARMDRWLARLTSREEARLNADLAG
jgi:PAS domain S-box-containing protein